LLLTGHPENNHVCVVQFLLYKRNPFMILQQSNFFETRRFRAQPGDVYRLRGRGPWLAYLNEDMQERIVPAWANYLPRAAVVLLVRWNVI
jgi:hypothetical protein